MVKKEVLRDDRDVFIVVIGSRVFAFDGVDDVDVNIKDIILENFFVFVRGKELLKNVFLKIFYGKRYGLIGFNGMGKFIFLKFLLWRKVFVFKNIDVFLVE